MKKITTILLLCYSVCNGQINKISESRYGGIKFKKNTVTDTIKLDLNSGGISAHNSDYDDYFLDSVKAIADTAIIQYYRFKYARNYEYDIWEERYKALKKLGELCYPAVVKPVNRKKFKEALIKYRELML